MSVLLRFPGMAAERISCVKDYGESSANHFVLARFAEPPVQYRIVERCPVSLREFTPTTAKAHDFDESGKELYCTRLSRLIDTLSELGGKAVISRQIHTKTELKVEDIFSRLCSLYPDAAVYAWPDGDSFWIGATPELLLKTDGRQLTTMSLAGTRASNLDEPAEWDAKNIEEQEIVTGFILDELCACGLQPEISTTYTRRAGPVEHICSTITADALSADALGVAERLSPTPAVAGYPRERAMRQIAEIESEPRGYYSGFFGIAGETGVVLYVTLRCMKVTASGKVTIYAGGGITHASVPEKEWEETCVKASTLLNVIN